MKPISLIANSGIQFYSTFAVFQPDEPAMVGDMPLPQMMFAEYPSKTPGRNEIQIAYPYVDKETRQKYAFLLSELRSEGCVKKRMSVSGAEDDELDCAGVPVIDFDKVNAGLLSDVGIQNCYTEYAMEGMFQLSGQDGCESTPPLERLLGKWIPAPMFYLNNGDKDFTTRTYYPSGWCRVKISFVERRKEGNLYRFDWAFDTTLAKADNVDEYSDPEEQDLPFFKSGIHKHTFGLPSRVGHLFQFVADNQWVGDYMQALIFGEGNLSNIPLSNGFITRCRHIAYYISLFTNLRHLDVCPLVTLYNCDKQPVPVDLILDVGNSCTCGLLVEDRDFSRSRLLGLRDLSETHLFHEGSFNMRLAFHRTEFGRGNMGTSGVFEWRSFLRIGEEAKRLISQSRRINGVDSDRMTHHSSPKRYLWDDQKFNGQWQFLLTDEDPVSEQRDGIYISRMTEQFKSDGSFHMAGDAVDDDYSNYSRRSLTTLVMIEILQQAMCQINSPEYLRFMGKEDILREIRKVIVTCPTAMPIKEQIALRQCAKDAMTAILRSRDDEDFYKTYDPAKWEDCVEIIPDPKDVEASQSLQTINGRREWSFDEASCCQFVYLYSEIKEKYNCNCHKFIDGKGHIRADLKAEGYNKKSLTIGSIDIGAGTTDLMICTYKYDYMAGSSVLTPVPLFWDSFYVAGDDILNLIVRTMVLRDKNDNEYRENYGPLSNALCALYIRECLENGDERPLDTIKREAQNRAYSKIVSFFSENNNNMSYEEQIMRTDFNVMVSLPIARKMLDMMKNGESAQDVSYEQIFSSVEPSEQLRGFIMEKFGIDLKKMKWVYSPKRVTECIIAKMDKLLKQLSVILYAYNCDIVLLAGRPMSLEPLTDLFLRYFPVSPDRLIRMLPKNDIAQNEKQRNNCYKVGQWFPSHDEAGYFKDMKPVVATGAYVGYLAAHNGIDGLQFDMSEMKRRMISTANYMGSLDFSKETIAKAELKLDPDERKSTADFIAHGLPHYIVCKQINTEHYQARPIYALSIKPEIDREQIEQEYNLQTVRFTVSRRFQINKEDLTLVRATDAGGRDIMDILQLKIQTLVTTDGQERYWLDSGAFKIEE